MCMYRIVITITYLGTDVPTADEAAAAAPPVAASLELRRLLVPAIGCFRSKVSFVTVETKR